MNLDITRSSVSPNSPSTNASLYRKSVRLISNYPNSSETSQANQTRLIPLPSFLHALPTYKRTTCNNPKNRPDGRPHRFGIIPLSATSVNLSFFDLLKKLNQLPRSFHLPYLASVTVSEFTKRVGVEIKNKFPSFVKP